MDINIILGPWPWYVSGPLISLIMLNILRTGGDFGVSSTLGTMCTMMGAGKKIKFFNTNWRDQVGNLFFVVGAIIGGFISSRYLSDGQALNISAETITQLSAIGIPFDGNMAPMDLFSWQGLLTGKGAILIIAGGFFVGFGTRWAGGCTSGHAISGLSNFQLPSLIAVVGFFLGGLFITHIVFPLLFSPQ